MQTSGYLPPDYAYLSHAGYILWHVYYLDPPVQAVRHSLQRSFRNVDPHNRNPDSRICGYLVIRRLDSDTALQRPALQNNPVCQ